MLIMGNYPKYGKMTLNYKVRREKRWFVLISLRKDREARFTASEKE